MYRLRQIVSNWLWIIPSSICINSKVKHKICMLNFIFVFICSASVLTITIVSSIQEKNHHYRKQKQRLFRDDFLANQRWITTEEFQKQNSPHWDQAPPRHSVEAGESLHHQLKKLRRTEMMTVSTTKSLADGMQITTSSNESERNTLHWGGGRSDDDDGGWRAVVTEWENTPKTKQTSVPLQAARRPGVRSNLYTQAGRYC